MAKTSTGVTFQVKGRTLEVLTDTAEAADRVWVERRAWLRLWSASRLKLRWSCPETLVEVALTYRMPPLQLDHAAGALGAAL